MSRKRELATYRAMERMLNHRYFLQYLRSEDWKTSDNEADHKEDWEDYFQWVLMPTLRALELFSSAVLRDAYSLDVVRVNLGPLFVSIHDNPNVVHAIKHFEETDEKTVMWAFKRLVEILRPTETKEHDHV